MTRPHSQVGCWKLGMKHVAVANTEFNMGLQYNSNVCKLVSDKLDIQGKLESKVKQVCFSICC